MKVNKLDSDLVEIIAALGNCLSMCRVHSKVSNKTFKKYVNNLKRVYKKYGIRSKV